MLEIVFISTLNGVLFGMLLFLMASGLTVIFSMMGVLNFAHASFYMLGAFFGFEISRHIGLLARSRHRAAAGREHRHGAWSATGSARSTSTATSPSCCSPSG